MKNITASENKKIESIRNKLSDLIDVVEKRRKVSSASSLPTDDPLYKLLQIWGDLDLVFKECNL